MGGKTGTTTSSVAIPPEVLARYNAVNTQAQATASTPFQQYSTDPNAFVAPLNEQQQAGINNINQQANAAQPGYQAAMAGTAGASQGYNAQNYQQDVQGYMNPYLQNAMGSTAAMMNQQNQQQQQQLQGSAIQQGAFGGDRGNVAQAALMGQQNLAMGQTLGQMANTGYQSAAQNYMTGLGQQGALAQQYGNLAGAAQTAGLQGAQAQVGAGTLGQQTTQAGQSALYNQFQQQQAYPFQVSQFLANIAEGTGALSGSTTTTTAPQSWFSSDARLKEDIKRVGTAKNGLPIYTFKYKGDDTEQTHTGYMAQDVEKVHPEAVGESNGFKTVNYEQASEPVHRAFGGAANSEGGVVSPQHAAEGYFNGGDVVSPYDLSAILASQQQSYAPFTKSGIYGGSPAGTPGGKGVVPAANLPVAHLGIANPARAQQGDTLMGDVQGAMNIGDTIKKANEYRKDIVGQPAQAAKAAVPASGDTPAQAAVAAQPSTGMYGFGDLLKQYLPQGQAHGGVVGYADGGGVEPYQTDDPMSQVVSDTEKDKGQHGLMTAQNPTGQPSSTLGDLSKIAAIPGEISGLGTMASTIGSGVGAAASGIGSFLSSLGPFTLALKDGGVAGREHHADGGDAGSAPAGGVVASADDSFDTSNDGFTSAVPQHWKPLLSAIKQPESGGQYDIQNGGKGRVDLNAPHPGVVGPDGTSTATGAYQFVKDTWDRTTGNAPMTPKNQDAAAIKLASQDYNKRTGRDLDADLQSNGVTPEMKAALSPTWAGLADRPAPNAAPAAVVSDQPGFQAPDSAAQKPSPLKGIGDALTSEQYLIPLLAGLGTMAGSNSRYLGAAILQGIGGGAKAYEDVQNNLMQRQLDQPIAQSRNIAVANQLQSGLVEYNATRSASGLPPVSLQEYARVSGYKGALPEGIQDTSSAQPSGQGFSYSIPEMNSLSINRNGVNIPAMNDQGYLRAFIAKNAGIQSLYMKGAVESAQHNLDQIVANQRTQNVAGETVNAPGAISAGQQSTLAGQRMAQSGDFVNQAISFNRAAPNIKQNLTDLENVYSQFRSGADTARASFQQLMTALDPQGNYPSLHDADASNYQSALKGAASLMTAQLAGLPAGAPKAELEALQRQIANPNMEPGAVHHIISRAKASVNYQDKMNMGYKPEEQNYDVQGYQNKFLSAPENDYEKFVNQTEAAMKPGAGMTGNITPEAGKVYQDANGNKARWDGSKYIKVQ